MFPLVTTGDMGSTTKKADEAENPKVFRHVGLPCNAPARRCRHLAG
jgi:hypothetical protein